MVHGNVIGLSDPKSCVEESEIGAKTGARAEEAEAEDTTEDDKTTVEEIGRVTERRCLRRERR